MDEYQLFKSLINVLTPVKTFNELSTRLKGKLEPEDIAFTIFEISKICPLCKDTRQIDEITCNVCTGACEHYVRYFFNRLKRYQEILPEIPKIWNRLLIRSVKEDQIK